MSAKKDPAAEALDLVVASGLARLERIKNDLDDALRYRIEDAAKVVAETKAALAQVRNLIEKAPRLVPDGIDAGLLVGQFTSPAHIDLARDTVSLEVWGNRFHLNPAVLRSPRINQHERLSVVVLLQKIPEEAKK